MRTGSSSIAISTWTICASTKRKHCDVRPEPRPVQPSTVLAAVQTAARRLRRWPAASLDRGCARRSANRQVGAKGWVCPIEQRDANFDLSSAGPPPMTDLLNIAHTTRGMLMDGVIVGDDVDGEIAWGLLIDGFEKGQPLLMAMTRRQAGDQLALEIIEGGKQGQGAMSHVIVGLGANVAKAERQPRLRALQCLALGFL